MDGGFSIADLLPGLPAAPAAGPPEAAQAAEFKNYLPDAALRKLAAPEVGTGPPGGNGKSRGALLGGFRPGGGDLPPGADPLPPGMPLPEGVWLEPGPLTARPPQLRPGTDPLTDPAGDEPLLAGLFASGLPLQRPAAGPDTAPIPLTLRQALWDGAGLDARGAAPALAAGTNAASAEGLSELSSPLQSLNGPGATPQTTAAELRGAAGNGLAGALPAGAVAAAAGAEPTVAALDQGNANGAALIRPDGAGVATPGRSLAPGQFELPLALNDARWDNAFANRVSWVVSEGMSAARLNVYPPELGQIELRVTFSNDQANVQFGVQHASVRDAVEQALPRLREMFEAAGIALGDTSVATQEQRDADPRAAGGDGEAGGAAQHGDAVLEELPIGDARAGHHHGMIDAFV